MALTDLQSAIMRCLAANRSETSYVAGGLALNEDWPRKSDDIDIFHDTDEEIGEAARIDLETLREAGFKVRVEIEIYGVVEAVVSKDRESTLIQWMSETRRRFFPIVRDNEWGARLHKVDLAVNKVLAASSRTKARDFVDLVSISKYMSPLGPLFLAAAGKPPCYSPQKMIDEVRRRGLSIGNDEFQSVKGIPSNWSAETIRTDLIAELEAAERYVMSAPFDLVGVLAVDANGVPVELMTITPLPPGVSLRRATEEPEVMPVPDAASEWQPPSP